MASKKVIGRLTSKQAEPLPDSFERFMVNRDGYKDRLGHIPAKVTPTDVKRIKERAAKGHLGDLFELYTKMEVTDPRYGGLVNSLKSAVASMPIKVVPAEGRSEGEQEIADDYAAVAEELFAHLDTHGIVRNMIDAYTHGVKVFELKYVLKEFPYNRKLWMLDGMRPISSSALKMDMQTDSDTYGELMIVTKDDPEGKPISEYPDGKIVVIEESQGEGMYDTLGISRKCLGWWLTKIYTQVYWAQYVEIYGQPLRIARYPEGIGRDSKASIKRFLELMGRNAFGMFPQGVDVQLKEANQQGSVTTYQDVLKYAGDEMALALLGQVETVGGRRQGSYAKAQVLNGIRFENLQNIAQIVSKGFKLVTSAIIRANYGTDAVERLLPSVSPLLVNPNDSESKVKVFNDLQQGGVAIPMEHIYEQLGIPKPKVGETIVVNGQVAEYEVGMDMPQKQSQNESGGDTIDEPGDSDQDELDEPSDQ